MSRQNTILLTLAAIILFVPLALQANVNFQGADDLTVKAIQAARPEYKPWFVPIWEPPSDEVTNYLFALQGAIGGLFIGYFVGRYRKPL